MTQPPLLPPTIDDRRRDDHHREAVERARSYVPQWDPESGDVGAALLGLFAELATDVTERLNRAPEKHRAAFFDRLGFGRDPPQPARLPLVFRLAEEVTENLAIPAGTQAVSEPEGDEAEQTFEIAEGEGFEAAPATLDRVHSVRPADDAIFEHQPGEQPGVDPRLFDGESLQTHALYVAHAEFFALEPERTFDVRIDGPTGASVFDDARMACTYHGTREVDGESVEGWHSLVPVEREVGEDETARGAGTVQRFSLPPGGEFVETTLPATDPDAAAPAAAAVTGAPPVTAVESRWLRFEWTEGAPPRDLFETRVSDIQLSLVGGAAKVTPEVFGTALEDGGQSDPGTGTGSDTPKERFEKALATAGAIVPEMLLANDVPFPAEADEGETLFPFGETPWPLDAFYVGSEEAFTKAGQVVFLRFEGMTDALVSDAEDGLKTLVEDILATYDLTADPSKLKDLKDLAAPLPDLDLSWEYWNGSGWAYLPNVRGDLLKGWVAFEVPDDIEATAQAGHDGHWIRARVLEDGHTRYVNRDGLAKNVWEMVSVAVPRFEALRIYYLPFLPKDPDAETPRGAATGSSAPSSGPTRTDEKTGGAEAEPADGRPPLSDSPQHVVPYNNRGYGRDEAGRFARPTGGASERRAPLTPFRRLPDETQTLYLGFDRPLENGPIQLLYSVVDKAFTDTFYPRARWEYCEDPANDAWTGLSARDGTESLTRRGIVRLVFPEPTTPFERFGRERHWIRARLIGNPFQSGDAGDGATATAAGPTAEAATAAEPPDGSSVVVETDPESGRVVVRNTAAEMVDLSGHSLAVESSGGTRRVVTLPRGSTVPPGGKLDAGAESAEGEREEESARRLRRALREAVGEADGGDGPTRVSVTAPDGRQVASSETGDEDERGAPDDADIVDDDPVRPCDALEPLVLATDPRATDAPPRLRGLYVNAGWADNVRTVTEERLGSSDGRPSQTFSFRNRPVIDEEVWVEELSTLPEETREALKRDDPDAVDERTDEDGAVTAFWVRWTQVESFADSTADARHYRIDRTAGTLTFGDGTRGAIPPRGEENVRADYRTGGGVDGNVRANAVTALTSALPFVDAVQNPEPGGGGADAETTLATLDRASRTLRDRNRAVTRADFERVAASASRELVRVKCIPGMDRSGAPRAGWVTVVLVPRTREPKPVPSPEVVGRVEKAYRKLAPAALRRTPTASDRIAVRGPSYVETGVQTEFVVSASADSVAAVENRAADRIEAFLHPLTGGPDGAGWEFGELPCLSDVYAALERIEDVDHVRDVVLTFQGRDRTVTVGDGDRRPTVAGDTLVFSGTHAVVGAGEPGAGDQTAANPTDEER